MEYKGRRLLLIVNPVAGRKSMQRHLTETIRSLMDAGYMVTTAVTGRGGEAGVLAERWARDFDCLVCAGGDGTLNETVSGLARAGVRKPLGYIPCGTNNDFALSRGLNTDIPEAVKGIVSGRTAEYDIGRFGESFFVNVAFFGAFSRMGYTTDQEWKNLLGYIAYLLDGVKDISRIKPVPMRLETPESLYEGEFVFGSVSNASSVGGIIELPRERVDLRDGLFELLLIRAPKTLLELESVVRSLGAGELSGPLIHCQQIRELRVDNPLAIPWSLDGESSGTFSHVEISPMPGFLQLLG